MSPDSAISKVPLHSELHSPAIEIESYSPIKSRKRVTDGFLSYNMFLAAGCGWEEPSS